jgi:predicted RNA binding protein YcfA (HicA-like mRNA interferase family)
MKKLKVFEILKMLKEDGWYELKSKGTSHRQFKHPVKKGKVTVNKKLSETLEFNELFSIFRQAGWK